MASQSIQSMLQEAANNNTAKTFNFNREEAEKARSWQTYMSNTSHQREVLDLQAAGLNPVLSSGGSGAQAYSTQSASGVADSVVNALGNLQATKISSSATRYAAKQNRLAAENTAKMNSAATVYAANQSAAASRYSSDVSSEASHYGTDRSTSGYYANLMDDLFGNSKNSSAKKAVAGSIPALLGTAGKIASALIFKKRGGNSYNFHNYSIIKK